MGITTATVLTMAALGGYSAYQQGKNEREALKQQYEIEEYNAQMDKMEKEVDLATQDKLLQKQIAESMAMQNNIFGEFGLEGSTGDLIKGTYQQGLDETNELQRQMEYVQNKYITTSAIRRKNFNKNLKSNRSNTIFGTISGGIMGGVQGYSMGSDLSEAWNKSGKAPAAGKK